MALNVTYNGIQEGITHDLHLFTEHTTGGIFAIRTDTENMMMLVAKRAKELIKKFESKEIGI
jgi:nicotinic acid phosphoribosyltransferase